jgi:homoserine O-acetyltransferase
MSLANTATQFSSPQHTSFGYAPSFAASAVAASAGRGVITVALGLRHAGTRHIDIAYEWQGSVDAPVVLVAGGISAGHHVASSGAFPDTGWWQSQVGPGRALDPENHCILAIDWLGADGTLDAPIDPADQADAIAKVLDALGIETLAAFVGCSYGAMVGLQFAVKHGDRVQQLVAISGSDRAHPYASAWRALQRRAVALGALQCDEAAGLALARELAMLSYRTPEEFAERFTAPAQVANGRVRCAAEDYLDACGQRYVERTAPTAFLRLSESIDLHYVDPATIRVPTTVVAVIEDRLVPVEDAFTLVERLPGARLKLLRSRFGHDAFLKEVDAIAAILRESLADETETRCSGGAA